MSTTTTTRKRLYEILLCEFSINDPNEIIDGFVDDDEDRDDLKREFWEYRQELLSAIGDEP